MLALQREGRPKALAIAAVVVLIPILLLLLNVVLVFRVGSASEEIVLTSMRMICQPRVPEVVTQSLVRCALQTA